MLFSFYSPILTEPTLVQKEAEANWIINAHGYIILYNISRVQPHNNAR